MIKQLTIVTMVVCMFGSNVNGWEIKNNPDQVPSLGYVYSNGKGVGSHGALFADAYLVGGFQMTETVNYGFGLDVRAPITEFMTVTAGYNELNMTKRYGGSYFLLPSVEKQVMKSYSIGCRLYFR